MSYRITLNETADTFEAEAGEPLLDAAERAGFPLAHDCRFGGCGACRVKLLEGQVDYEEFPFGLSEEEAAEGYALACQAHAQCDLTISATLLPAGHIPADFHVATIERLEKLSHDVTHLVLRIPTASEVDFHPGQYLNVMLDDGSPRSFSMASPPNGELFDFHIRRVPGGYFTGRLETHYKPGDALDVELPLGTFRHDADSPRDLLMVAGGTGLAPIKSIIESLLDSPDTPNIALYWGVRRAEDLYLDDLLHQWTRTLPNFRYVPVLSEGDDQWGGRRGFVHEAVCQDHQDLSAFDAYLCGPPPMIAAAKSGFSQRGLSVERIFSDSFNFTHELDDSVV
ncbi:2Fe-2S iron-sulfur cluster-binding protein [Halomonas sp. EGI 63088]|uniref:2Fe-2S iron-sulfur cluster-binding protein n=1 Tax=Halomonas flagellata TaxID=2920385 RepID=A0ABS9RQD0_9GAMM|nr:2Fe-2S iron-sulfur cluster-binding protein [Halomonas flagellata]MCH4562022.1 2Fe-2S iron-sulfur cluster-binding protein [Halomonas flagellata]